MHKVWPTFDYQREKERAIYIELIKVVRFSLLEDFPGVHGWRPGQCLCQIRLIQSTKKIPALQIMVTSHEASKDNKQFLELRCDVLPNPAVPPLVPILRYTRYCT